MILVEEEMDRLCTDSGQRLFFDTLDRASLNSISSTHTSLNVSQFQENGKYFLLFSPCGQDKDAFFRICMKNGCPDDIPCAFFHQKTKRYENFSIPAQTGIVDVSVEDDGRMTIRWGAEAEYDEETVDDFDSTVDDFEDSDDMDEPDGIDAMNGEPDDEKTVRDELADRQRELEEMRCHVARLEDENQRLRQQPPPAPDELGNSVLRSENERLRKLISQLADSGYDGGFEQTLDAQIDEQTRVLVQRRKAFHDKQHSLELLKEEKDTVERQVGDVTKEIDQVMEMVQKGESALRESSSRLDETRRLLDEKLHELGIDEATLRLYTPNQSAEQLIRESDQLRERVEEKLQELISDRQEDANQRFDRVTS